jgi:hypothetical protein
VSHQGRSDVIGLAETASPELAAMVEDLFDGDMTGRCALAGEDFALWAGDRRARTIAAFGRLF